MKKFLLFTLFAMFLVGCNKSPCKDYVPGSIETEKVKIAWTSPENNTQDLTYMVQLSENGGDYFTIGSTTDTFYVLDTTMIDYCNSYRGRVYAVNSYGISGPFSKQSRPYTPVPNIEE